MPYSVIVIDDEEPSLRGVIKTFPWDKYGFTVAASTTNSKKGYDLIRRLRPDAVFVDIRMPGLSGLDIIKKVRAWDQSMAFVIVSGHADFQYAQDAIKGKVFDYCLKPIRRDRTDEILGRLRDHILSSQGEDKGFLNRLENGDILMKELGFDKLLAEHSNAHCRFIISDTRMSHEMLPLFERDDNILGSHYFTAQKGWGLLVIQSDGENDPCFKALGVPLGVSSGSRFLSDLPRLYAEGQEALRDRWIYDNESVFISRPERNGIVNTVVEDILFYAGNNDLESIGEYYHNLPDYIRREDFTMKEIDLLNRRLISAINSFLEVNRDERRISTSTQEDIKKTYPSLENLIIKLEEWTLMYLFHSSFKTGTSPSARGRYDQLINYVNLHYNEDLRMSELADQFGFHPNYGATIFKEYTGKSFRDYLKQLRMVKAVEYLHDTAMSLDEIARTIGYDYYYFNKQFSKKFSCSPGQYRKLHARKQP